MTSHITLAELLLIAAMGGALAGWSHYMEKKRTRGMKLAADKLGFRFTPKDGRSLLFNLGGSYLFSRGRDPAIANLIEDGENLAIFDYTYTSGYGEQRHSYRQTVMAFRLPGRVLPIFCLRPERVWHDVGAWFGQQDINFDRWPAFSSKYLLQGRNEEAVRKLFTDDVIAFYHQTKGLSTEGNGEWLMFYRHQITVAFLNLPSFMKEGLKIRALFDSATS